MPAIARLAGKRVRSSECLLNSETVSKFSAVKTGAGSGLRRPPGGCKQLAQEENERKMPSEGFLIAENLNLNPEI